MSHYLTSISNYLHGFLFLFFLLFFFEQNTDSLLENSPPRSAGRVQKTLCRINGKFVCVCVLEMIVFGSTNQIYTHQYLTYILHIFSIFMESFFFSTFFYLLFFFLLFFFFYKHTTHSCCDC